MREVKAVGTTVGIRQPGITASVSRITVALSVVPESGAPFEVDHREFMLGSDLASLQRGATVPVRLGLRDPRQLAIDWDALEG